MLAQIQVRRALQSAHKRGGATSGGHFLSNDSAIHSTITIKGR